MDRDAKSTVTMFGERLIAATTETGEIELEGVTYPYRICEASMQPDVKYFTGFGEHTGVGKELFISADVPPEFRYYVFLHEVRCIPRMGEPHHCSSAERHVLTQVPTIYKSEYLDMRGRMFADLITYLEKLPRPPVSLIREMRETREFLKTA